MTAATVRLRFFAAASAAVGADERTVDLDGDASIDTALTRASAAASSPDAARVLARCSFLVNGLATSDRATVLSDGDLVDVMPPFAGG